MLKKIIISSVIITGLAMLIYGAEDKPKDAPPEKPWVEYPMTYSADWKVIKDITTINPQLVDMTNNKIPLPNLKAKDKKGFRCSAGPKSVTLDVDGDNKLEKELKDKENFVEFKVDYDDGTPVVPYMLRVWQKSVRRIVKEEVATWAFQRACFMQGKTPLGDFILIDDNNNGYYDDLGEDAIIIGSGASRQVELLSKLISIKGKFYECKTHYTGNKLSLKEYQGQIGKIDMVKGFNFPNQKIENAVIAGDDNVYFNIPLQAKYFVLPVGEYSLYSAVISKGKFKVIGNSGSKVKVEESDPKSDKEKNKPVLFVWGAPFKFVPEPICEKGGVLVNIIPPATYVAPKREDKPLDCPFVKIKLPKILGCKDEEYVTNEIVKDDNGQPTETMADVTINKITIEIVDKAVKKEPKPLNKIGYPLVDAWIQVDMSGLVQKSIPWWEKYQCPMYDFRGTVIIRMTTKSNLFGELKYEGELEITDK
ncbi:MAG: hypothetical protein WC980_10460 [Candidatus Brocadiia bacterium]